MAVFLWIFFIVIEFTDFIDGYAARKTNQVTDLGKVMDPFADVFSRITYFLCFTGFGIMPIWLLTIFIYREFSMTFLRLLMIRQQVVLAASRWGKLKALTYGISGVLGLIVVTLTRLFPESPLIGTAKITALIIFIAAAVAALASFTHYFLGAKEHLRENTDR